MMLELLNFNGICINGQASESKQSLIRLVTRIVRTVPKQVDTNYAQEKMAGVSKISYQIKTGV